jgi:hypothetical protein
LTHSVSIRTTEPAAVLETGHPRITFLELLSCANLPVLQYQIQISSASRTRFTQVTTAQTTFSKEKQFQFVKDEPGAFLINTHLKWSL